MRIAGQAVFLTGDGHTIHAWVHGPSDGHVRGAVIAAPALARDEAVSHRSMRFASALPATSPLPLGTRVPWNPSRAVLSRVERHEDITREVATCVA